VQSRLAKKLDFLFKIGVDTFISFYTTLHSDVAPWAQVF